MSGISFDTKRSAEATLLSRSLQLDWAMIAVTLLTVFIGVLMVHSTDPGGRMGLLPRQITAAGVGVLGMAFFALLPYQVFRGYGRPIYIFMILVLIAVLVFGVTLRGTKAWFHLGPVYLQSSEVIKLPFVLSMAAFLDRRIDWFSPRSLFFPIVLAGFPIFLIFLQPDLSSALVFFPMALVMCFLAGARTLHLLAVCLVAGLAVGVPLVSTYLGLIAETLTERPVLLFLADALDGGWPAVWLFLGVCLTLATVWGFLRKMRVYIPSLYLWVTLLLLGVGTLGAIAGDRAMKDYQRRRLVAFVNPHLDPLGGGYNVLQSQIAIGSGRVAGKGYGQGTQSRLGFLPSRHTDFIFAVVGEELGFVRALAVLGLYFFIIWRAFETALLSRDRFGGMIAAGFGSMFAFYALLNLGMTMGIAPVAGVPLPMLSYGGSSVASSMLAVGIILSIHWRRYML